MSLNTETAKSCLELACKSLDRNDNGEALMWIDEAQSLLEKQEATA